MLKTILFRLTIAWLLVVSVIPVFKADVAAVTGGTAIIADHNIVDQYDKIPQEYITKIKTMRLNIAGESHSTGYLIGLELLSDLEPTKYPASVTFNPALPEPYRDNALRADRYVEGVGYATGEAEWYTWHAFDNPEGAPYAHKIKNHLDYCDNITPGIAISAIGFGWCWDMLWSNPPGGGEDPVYHVHWAGSSVGGPDGGTYGLQWGLDDEDTALTENRVNMDDYLQATEAYIQYIAEKGYDTKVFFTTGPVESNIWLEENPAGEAGYQREIKHNYIREHFDDNYPNAALFDYADILAYNDAGVQNTLSWNAHTYQFIHPDNLNDYDNEWNMIPNETDYPGAPDYHIGEVGALRLGKAMWWLLARLAGWDGEPAQHISVTIEDNSPAGLSFGNPSPGAVKQAEATSPSITITTGTENTRDVGVYLKGTDFTGAAGTFSVANAFYNDSDNSGTALPMSNSYNLTAWKEIPPGETLNIYHWLSIPAGTPAGSYSSNFIYKAQEAP
jgi:hypothetical protein